MVFLSALVYFLVGVCVIAGSVSIVVAAFRHSLGWGLAVIFVPFAFIAFAISYWSEVRSAFFITLAPLGAVIALVVVAALVVPLMRHKEKPQPVVEAPASKTDSAAMVVSTPSTPEPAYIAPPPPPKPAPVAAEPEPDQPVIKKVYVDNASHKFFPEDCKNLPPNAYKMARTLAVGQGYKEAACP